MRLRLRAPDRRSANREAPSEIRILTDRFGRIVESCPNTPAALNWSHRGLNGRPLHLFITDDRLNLFRQLNAAFQGQPVVVETTLQGRDRRPKAVQISIQRIDKQDSTAELEWVIDLIPRALHELV